MRIYHDNALSKEPGCGRTPWHHDDEHFPLDTLQAVTAWMPVSAIPAPMGPLSFARGAELREVVAGLEFDKVGTTYDVAVSQRFGASERAGRPRPPFAVGEVSLPLRAVLPHRRPEPDDAAAPGAGHDLLRRRGARGGRADADQRHLAGVPARHRARGGGPQPAQPGGRPRLRLAGGGGAARATVGACPPASCSFASRADPDPDRAATPPA